MSYQTNVSNSFLNQRFSLAINSAIAQTRTSGTNFEVQLIDEIKDLKRIYVDSIGIPNTYYNVEAFKNNDITYLDQADAKQTVYIEPGYYNSTSLATAVTAALNGTVSSVNVNVSYGVAQNTIITINGGNLTIASGAVGSLAYYFCGGAALGPGTTLNTGLIYTSYWTDNTNITSSNNSLNITYKGTPLTVFIPAQVYINYTYLVYAVTIAMENIINNSVIPSSGNFNTVYSGNTYKYTISNSVNQFTITSTGAGSKLLGFTQNSTKALSATGNIIANLSGYDYLSIFCPQIAGLRTNKAIIDGIATDAIYFISLNRITFDIITAKNYGYGNIIANRGANLDTLTFVIRTPDGDILDNKGSDTSLKFIIELE